MLQHDTKREYLPLVLDINKETKQGEIKDKILAIQFYPLGVMDRLIEIQKNEFDHYPFHNLILFTLDYDPSLSNGKKVLICYIELFSTFQWYVILNGEYYGDSIYEYYAQQILKKDDYIVEFGHRYYKERNLYLDPLGITQEDINKKYDAREDKNKNHFDIEYEMIQKETIKQKYKFDFEGYIHNIICGISDKVMLIEQKEQFQKPEFKNTDFGKFVNNKYLMSEYEIFEDIKNIMNFKQNFDLFFSQRYNEKYDKYDKVFSIDSYRKIYIENSNLKNYTDSIKYIETLSRNEDFKVYRDKKMYMLEKYIHEETMKYKMKND